MEVEFLHDPDTNLLHISKHGVSPIEVLDILRRPESTVRGRGDSYIAEGRTRDNRILRVIYKRELDDTILVITAYDLQGNSLRAFRRRQRRRPR